MCILSIDGSKVLRANVERNGDLPSSSLSKIQALYKRILSAADSPAIIDWVQAAESKINNLERELENTNKALNVSQLACENYQKKVMLHATLECSTLLNSLSDSRI